MAILSDKVLTWEDVFGETYVESVLKLIALNAENKQSDVADTTK